MGWKEFKKCLLDSAVTSANTLFIIGTSTLFTYVLVKEGVSTQIANFILGISSNPKVILFFLSFLPKFMCLEKGHLVRQFMTLGGIFILSTLLSFNIVALCGGGIARALAQWPSAPRFLQYFTAVVLFGLSAWIAWTTCRSKPTSSEAKT